MIVGPKVLYIDIEVAPNIAAAWGIHEQRISYNDIIQEWFILSVQWSWDNSKKVNKLSVLDNKRGKKITDDSEIVRKISEIISEADEVVGHNIKQYDLKRINAKIIEHKLPPLRIPTIVDTLVWARQFGFTSRKLGDLCKKLGLENKLSHSPGVFIRAAMGDRKAIQEIVEYGVGDIPTVRDLHLRLRPYATTVSNNNLYRGDGVKCCPKCGHEQFQARGFSVTITGKYQRFQCSGCGGWFKSGKSVKRVEMR